MTRKKTSKSEAAETSAATERPRARRRFLRFVLVLSVLILSCGLYLTLVGLPDSTLRKIELRLASQGHHLQIRKIRWDLLDGVVVEDIQLFPSESSTCPCITAERVDLEMNPFEWFKKKSGLRGARIRGGVFRTHSTAGLTGLAHDSDPENISLENIRCHVRLESTGLAIEELSASLFGISLEGSGYLVRPHKPIEGSLIQAWLSLYRDRPEEEKKKPEWVAPLVAQLNAAEFGEDPRGTIEFSLHPLHLDSNEAAITAKGKDASARGQQFEEWRLAMQLRGPQMDLTSSILCADRREMRLSAALAFNERTAEARLFSSLRPEMWDALSPQAVHVWLRDRDILPKGELETELKVGPASYEALAETFEGWISLRDAIWRGAHIDDCKMFISRKGDVVHLSDIQADIGQGKEKGHLSAEIAYDLSSKTFIGAMNSHFDPHAAVTLVGAKLAGVIEDFEFSQSHPVCDVSFSGAVGQPESYGINGHITGTNFSFRGPLLRTFDTDMGFTNSTLVFDNLAVTRDEGHATGRVELNLADEVVDLDVISSVDPKALGNVIGPAVSKLLEPFKFTGRAHIAVKGMMDYAVRREMDFQAVVNAEGVSYDWLKLDRCSFKLVGKDNEFNVHDIEGVVYEGAFAGEAVLQPEGSTEDLRYGVRGSFTNIDFRALMEDAKGLEDSDPYRGLVEGQLKMSGIIGEGQCATVNGAGNLRIKEGSLLRVPLFGGLSRFLGKLYPGLGFIAQTDFRTDFKIHDCEFRAKDMVLEGKMIRVTGEGRYRFDQRLDFKVQVRLLRESTVARVLNIITYPITKIFLEFHLGGSAEEPNWRPVNLPKEMYLIFD